MLAYHSLEDRMVKERFAAWAEDRRATWCPASRPSPRRAKRSCACSRAARSSPTDEEVAANPRARSARLRAAEQLTASRRESAAVPRRHARPRPARAAGAGTRPDAVDRDTTAAAQPPARASLTAPQTRPRPPVRTPGRHRARLVARLRPPAGPSPSSRRPAAPPGPSSVTRRRGRPGARRRLVVVVVGGGGRLTVVAST